MKDPISHAHRAPFVPGVAQIVDSMARRLVLQRFRGLTSGTLTLSEAGQVETVGRPDPAFPVAATITVHDQSAYRAIAAGGITGAAEAYMDGHWSADDLTAVVRILVRNLAVLQGFGGGTARLGRPFLRLWHWMRRNTRTGSSKNIAAHYDLGNDFYRLFLDETMMYSCALFESEDTPLADASTAKNERICRKLALTPSDHLLEIGTGWGGFALHAASRFGCRVTTTTISREQHRLATERVAAAGLADRVEVLLADYRDLRGRYDKLVSIEMIEAVGHEFLPAFFSACGSLLAPEGTMLLQAITMPDDQYERYRRSVDFIQRHIFPGSCVPSFTALCNAMASSSDLRVGHVEELTPHYALTLRRWRERLLANLPAARALGLTDRFLRMWEFYLAYCEGGFAERRVGSVQVMLHRPLSRHAPLLPRLDAGNR